MPLRKNKATATPKNGNRGKKDGWKGEERTVVAPKLISSLGQKDTLPLPPMKYSNKKWYVYDSKSGFYKQSEDNYICYLIQQQLGDVSSHQILDSVNRIKYSVHHLGRFHPSIRYDEKDILNNVLNGVTRIKPDGSHSLEKHDEKWCFNGVLPVEYDLKATCPIFDEELKTKLLDPLDQKVILFFGGYCLIPDCRFGITLFNYGPSHTGKSTLIVHGLGAVFGDQISSLKLNEICPENFSGISHVPVLANKLLNVGSEIDGREVRDTTNFKRLISGETVMAREAFREGGEILTFCKLAFNMNELPKINGTDAEAYRIRIVWFNRITNQNERSFDIEKSIKLEGSGMYMRFLNQMPELLKINEFPYGSVFSQSIYGQLKEKIDPFTHFMQTYEKELELGPQELYTMQSTEIDPYVMEFLKVNNYENIFYLDIFKRRLYARFNIKSEQQWRPLGAPRSQQKKVTVLFGIQKRQLTSC